LTSELAPRLVPLKICWPPCWRWTLSDASAAGSSAPYALLTAARAPIRLF